MLGENSCMHWAWLPDPPVKLVFSGTVLTLLHSCWIGALWENPRADKPLLRSQAAIQKCY